MGRRRSSSHGGGRGWRSFGLGGHTVTRITQMRVFCSACADWPRALQNTCGVDQPGVFRKSKACAHPPALSSTSHRPQRWLRRRVLARNLAVHLGSCREGYSGARALRVLPRLGSGARRDRELRAARFWPNLIARRCGDPTEPYCAALRGSGRLPLRLSLVERRAPTPLLTAAWRAPRTHGTLLAGTSTAVPRPSCKLEAGHHRGSWR